MEMNVFTTIVNGLSTEVNVNMRILQRYDSIEFNDGYLSENGIVSEALNE